ncbi:MAG: hypothetical protein OHK0013_03020 [Sandaracinaceae bacterium]
MGAATRKITVNLPETELATAMEITGKGITETLLQGLREIARSRERAALRKLRGKVAIDLDLGRTRR